jgi:hypothetical protein
VPPHTQQAVQEVPHLYPIAITPLKKCQACTSREVLKHGVRLTRLVAFQEVQHLFLEAPSVHEEGGSQTPGASDKSGELLPLQWTWTRKEQSRSAPETWTSRIPVAPGPRLPIAQSEYGLARRTKARFNTAPHCSGLGLR